MPSPSPIASNATLFRMIRAAQAAPSIHNTQPWSFWVRSDDLIELRANRKRHLAVADPRGRELTISCGAALFNLRMAIRTAGYDPVIWLVPDEKDDPALLASVAVKAARDHSPTTAEQQLYDAIPRRHTNREPFTGRRVPMNIVTELEHAAWREHAKLRLLHSRETGPLLRAAAAADRELGADLSYVNELTHWTGCGLGGLGIPVAAFGPVPKRRLPGAPPAPVRDLSLGHTAGRGVERFERRARLMVLSTENDRPLDWLRAGQALQRVLLTATRRGVAASFLTQPFEVDDRRRRATGRQVPQPAYPHMVIRLGYGPQVTGTTREPYPEVLDCRIQPPLPMRLPTVTGPARSA